MESRGGRLLELEGHKDDAIGRLALGFQFEVDVETAGAQADECCASWPDGFPCGTCEANCADCCPGFCTLPAAGGKPDLNKVLHVPVNYKLTSREDRINHSAVKAKREPRQRACPKYGCVGHVHGRPTRKACRLPVKGVPLVVLLEGVRFKCPGCGRTYYDDYSDLVSGLSPHITSDLESRITLGIIDKMSIATVSRREDPSEEPITKALDAAVSRCSYLLHTLCIDEFSAHTEKGHFAATAPGGDHGCLVEALERPCGDCLGDFFSQFSPKEHTWVECFSCDMSSTPIAAKEIWFPGTKLCIDCFHVVNEAVAALDEVRVRATGSKEPDDEENPTKKDRFTAKEEKGLRRARRWFRRRRADPESVDAERRDRLRGRLSDMGPRDLDDLMPKPRAPKCGRVDALLEWDRELKAAYQLLQLFYAWSDMKWCAEKRGGLESRCKLAMRSGIPELKAAARAFRRHCEGVLNDHRHGKTNALAEGLDDAIKSPEKASYGMPALARMRRHRPPALGHGLTRNRVHLPQVEAEPEPRTQKQADAPATHGTGAAPLSMHARQRRSTVMPLA